MFGYSCCFVALAIDSNGAEKPATAGRHEGLSTILEEQIQGRQKYSGREREAAQLSSAGEPALEESFQRLQEKDESHQRVIGKRGNYEQDGGGGTREGG